MSDQLGGWISREDPPQARHHRIAGGAKAWRTVARRRQIVELIDRANSSSYSGPALRQSTTRSNLAPTSDGWRSRIRGYRGITRGVLADRLTSNCEALAVERQIKRLVLIHLNERFAEEGLRVLLFDDLVGAGQKRRRELQVRALAPSKD